MSTSPTSPKESSMLLKKNDEPPTYDFDLKAPAIRILVYSSLIITLLVGYITTTAFNIKESQKNGLDSTADSEWPTLYLDNNTIFNIFGYNNICIYIDDLPGKYITAWLFQMVILFYVAYVLVTHVNVYICYKTGIYSNWLFNILRATTFLDMLLASYSIEIFAVHPKESMLMHTLPFSALICGTSLCGMRNVIHDLHVVDYKRSTLPCARTIEIVYGVLLVFFSAWKLVVQYRGIVLHDDMFTPPGQFSWSQLNDILWLIFAVAIPLMKSILEVCSPRMLNRHDELLQVSIRMSKGCTEITDIENPCRNNGSYGSLDV